MLNHVSWSAYLTFMGISALVYYSFIIFFYYRQSLLLAIKKKVIPSEQQSSEPEESLHPIVQSFSDEVTAFLAQASYAKADKNDIINGLQAIARKFSGSDLKYYRNGLNRVITFEAKDKCAVHIDERDIDKVWAE